MSDLYEPTSEFLKLVANGSVLLAGNEFADANLQQLIDLTSDSDVSNRDWATFLLSSCDLDTPLARKTLHLRLLDDDPTVQEEALVGLALRQDLTALPQLKDWLQTRPLSSLLLEAAEAFADQSLCDLLLLVQPKSNEEFLRHLWEGACMSCRCTMPAAKKHEQPSAAHSIEVGTAAHCKNSN